MWIVTTWSGMASVIDELLGHGQESLDKVDPKWYSSE